MKTKIKALVARVHEGEEKPEILEELSRELIREGFGNFPGLVFFEGEVDWFLSMVEMENKADKMAVVVVQFWEESRGWGTRPEGCSVHFTEEECKQYTQNLMEDQHKTQGETVPDEYYRPEGDPHKRIISQSLLKELKVSRKEGKLGLRLGREKAKTFGLYSKLSKLC